MKTGNKQFKPMLAQTWNPDKVKFPVLASTKYDGIRVIFHPQLGMVSRALKPIKNVQLREKFARMIKLSVETGLIFDGEMFTHEVPFELHSSLVNTSDFLKQEKYRKHIIGSELSKYYTDVVQDGEYGLPMKFENPLEYRCFDVVDPDDNAEVYSMRCVSINIVQYQTYVHPVIPTEILDIATLTSAYETAISEGNEGLIFRDPNSLYKYGRSTVNDQCLLRMKPSDTFDAIVIGVYERMENTNESFKNELGRSTKRNTKDDKAPTGIAAGFIVEFYNDAGERVYTTTGEDPKVTLTGDEAFRREIWNTRDEHVGKMIEFDGMGHGSKNVPRFPVFKRFRMRKDE